MKIEIENKEKLKTNHWKYYETKTINESNVSQKKPTHKSKETQTNPQKKDKMKPTKNPKVFMIQI